MTDRYEYHSFSAVSAERSAWKPARKGYGRTVLYAVTFWCGYVVFLCVIAAFIF